MDAKIPREMGLGEIVRELNILTAVKILSGVIGFERAYAMAPTYCRNINDLDIREDLLYDELDKREGLYNERFSEHGSF